MGSNPATPISPAESVKLKGASSPEGDKKSLIIVIEVIEAHGLACKEPVSRLLLWSDRLCSDV
ncbi:hypothetical protein NDA03_19085 [Trichocoleus sp. Lan]|uniref:hypothetical protein n=1 Tax=Trichocoleus sp. Lan TaxID=2933927 RepID=UPI0032995BEF